jgi:hypothetical protein
MLARSWYPASIPTTSVLLLLAALLSLGACSDDSKTTADANTIDLGHKDHRLAEGAGSEPASDLSTLESSPSDAHRERVVDGGGSDDSDVDARVVDAFPADLLVGPGVYGTVTRNAAPLLDGKGILYVALYNMLFPPPIFPPVASFTDSNADLSASGAKIPYSIYTGSGGTYYLLAVFDDNQDANLNFLAADGGDLTMTGNPQKVTLSSTAATKLDLVLDKAEGAFTDGGMGDFAAFGGLKGKITTTATLSGDGKGTITVTLGVAPPPATALYSSQVVGANLSSPYAHELYFMSSLPPGNYYLYAYLDDNSNAKLDKGDLVMKSAAQVHVVAGTLNAQDLVLDQTQP